MTSFGAAFLWNNYLRFFQRVWWSIWRLIIFQDVLCPTQLFQWKLICTFNQHCLRYKISNRLQFNSSLFFWKLFETVLHWHYFFYDVPLIQKTYKYINTDTYTETKKFKHSKPCWHLIYNKNSSTKKVCLHVNYSIIVMLDWLYTLLYFIVARAIITATPFIWVRKVVA